MKFRCTRHNWANSALQGTLRDKSRAAPLSLNVELMPRPSRFFVKFCANGHLIYADEAPSTATNCQICGEKFIEQCGNCGKALGNTFVARVSYLTKKPEPLPVCRDQYLIIPCISHIPSHHC